MNAVLVETKLYKALNSYRSHYLNKQLENLDESSTRIIINHLLSDVLGYKELVDIKTEYPVRGGFIDYLIKLSSKKLIVVEAKSIGTKLSDKHLRQAIYYAITIGADWIILTNGRDLELFKVRYSKPIKVKRIFSIDLKKNDDNTRYFTPFLTKRSVIGGELDNLSKIYEELLV